MNLQLISGAAFVIVGLGGVIHLYQAQTEKDIELDWTERATELLAYFSFFTGCYMIINYIT